MKLKLLKLMTRDVMSFEMNVTVSMAIVVEEIACCVSFTFISFSVAKTSGLTVVISQVKPIASGVMIKEVLVVGGDLSKILMKLLRLPSST